MSKYAFLLISAFALSANAAYAQTAAVADCEESDDDTCLALPVAGDVQNFLPGIIPLIGGSSILAAGLANGSSTTSTTSTTSTN